jgi:hypothetical protein
MNHKQANTPRLFRTTNCYHCYSNLRRPVKSIFLNEFICHNCYLWETKIVDAKIVTEDELRNIGEVPNVDFEIHWGSKPT